MLKNKFEILVSLLGLCLFFVVPIQTKAAFNDIVFSADTNIELSGSSQTVVILSGGEVAGYVVGTTSIAFDMENGSEVTIRSNTRADMVNEFGFEDICNDSYSEVTFTSSTTRTITLTPTGTCTPTVNSSTGSGGGDSDDDTEQSNELHPLGTNIKDASGTVFTITLSDSGKTIRRPYTSWGAYLSYGFNTPSNIINANTSDLALEIGSFIPPQDGRVICSDRGDDKGTCYLITQGQKAGFISASVFVGQGFSFTQVFLGDVSFLASTNNISSSAQKHLPGTLINNKGTIQLIGSQGLAGFPTYENFLAWGYDFSMVVPINSADGNLSQVSIVPTHQPGQIRLWY